jgi:NitT/TauT family transport system substrate-binding protein
MRHRFLLSSLSALAFVCGCATVQASAAELTKVTIVQMHPAIGVGEEVFMYAVPKQLGYFKDEGLDVSIQGVGGGGASAQVLQSGGAQFGTTMPESILQVREQGGDVIAFYQLKRNTGTIMVVKEDSPIHKLEDLKGKSVGAASFGAGGGLAVKEYLAKNGIPPEQWSAVSTGVNPAAFTALDTKQIDALILWDGMRGALENSGMKIRAVEVPDQDKVGAMTFATTDRFLKEKPEAAKGMCRAIAKGLRFALANTDAAIKLFWKEFPTTKPVGMDEATALRNQHHIMDRWFEMSEQGVKPGGETGEMLPATWALTREIYSKAGVLKGTIPAEQGYTTKFTGACNDFDRAAVNTQASAMN